MLKSVGSALRYALNGYIEDDSDEEYKVELQLPKKQEIRREFYETDYKDLKASLSSIYALPPKFPFTGQTVPKVRRPARDLLRLNKRSLSAARAVFLEDVRKLSIRQGRRSSCCCKACGGYRLSQKFLIAQLPESEGYLKPSKQKVTGLDGFMKNIQNLNTKTSTEALPALLGIGKLKTLMPQRRQELVVSPPVTPRLHQLLDDIKQQEHAARERRQALLSTRNQVWQRIQSHRQTPSLPGTKSCEIAPPSAQNFPKIAEKQVTKQVKKHRAKSDYDTQKQRAFTYCQSNRH